MRNRGRGRGADDEDDDQEPPSIDLDNLTADAKLATLYLVAEEQAKVSAMQGDELRKAAERVAAGGKAIDIATQLLRQAGGDFEQRLSREVVAAAAEAGRAAAGPLERAMYQSYERFVRTAFWRGILWGSLGTLVITSLAWGWWVWREVRITGAEARNSTAISAAVYQLLEQRNEPPKPEPTPAKAKRR